MSNTERKSLFVYVLISYAFTWLCWITALLMGYKELSFLSIISWKFENTQEIILFLIFRIGVYGPLIASLIVSYKYFKSEGIKYLWSKIIKFRVKVKWYIFMLLLPVILNLVVVLICMIMGLKLRDFFNSGMPFYFIFLFFIYQVFTSGLEEPGWRGFVHEKLREKYTADKTSWIVGLIWAVWHYPFVLTLYLDAGIHAAILSLAGFTMSIIGQTFIFTWFYNNTRSVFIAILLHAGLNTASTFILGNITISKPVLGIIPALVTWSIVFVLLGIYGSERMIKENNIKAAEQKA